MKTRNLMAFEAPIVLTERTKQLAEDEMCSTSAICRRALHKYIDAMDERKTEEQFISY